MKEANQQVKKLEELINQTTLPEVLEDISQVCREKAAHMRDGWDKSARLIDQLVDKISSFY